jgi:hypothetical protein
MCVETRLARLWNSLIRPNQGLVNEPAGNACRERRSSCASKLDFAMTKCHRFEGVVEDEVELVVCELRSREGEV